MKYHSSERVKIKSVNKHIIYNFWHLLQSAYNFPLSGQITSFPHTKFFKSNKLWPTKWTCVFLYNDTENLFMENWTWKITYMSDMHGYLKRSINIRTIYSQIMLTSNHHRNPPETALYTMTMAECTKQHLWTHWLAKMEWNNCTEPWSYNPTTHLGWTGMKSLL